MAKMTRSTLSLLLPTAGEEVRWRLACRRRESGSCVLSAPSQWQLPSPGVGRTTKSCSCLDGRLTQAGLGLFYALSLHPPPPLNNTILPPKIKLNLYLYNTPPSPAPPPSRSSRGLCYRQEIAGARWLCANISWGAAAPRAKLLSRDQRRGVRGG